MGPTPTIPNNQTPFFANSESQPPPPLPPLALTKRIVMRKIPLPCLLPQLSLKDFFFTPPLAYTTPTFSSTTPIPQIRFCQPYLIQHTPPCSNSCVNYPPPPLPWISFCVYNPGSSLLYQSSGISSCILSQLTPPPMI